LIFARNCAREDRSIVYNAKQEFAQKMGTCVRREIENRITAGLPDFSWDMIPKHEKMYRMNNEMNQMIIK
jgi:hypothetical protein